MNYIHSSKSAQNSLHRSFYIYTKGPHLQTASLYANLCLHVLKSTEISPSSLVIYFDMK